MTCWIIGMLLIFEVENSCVLVSSSKHGDLKVVKGKPNDSRCHESIILHKSANKRYCIAKDPKPKNKVTLKCKKISQLKGSFIILTKAFQLVFIEFHWCYEGDCGPAMWGKYHKACNGNKQSPIDVPFTNEMKSASTSKPLNFAKYSSGIINGTLVNTGHSVVS